MKSDFVSALAAALLLAGCATPPGSPAAGSSSSWDVDVPYHYPLQGMGGGSIVGSIVVADQQELKIASEALVLSLQDRQLSVVAPPVGLDGSIPGRTKWKTDVAPLAPQAIAAYNQAFPNLGLRPALYGISYEGEHDTGDRRFRYRIAALLFEKGQIGSWSAVGHDRYAGQFFVQDLARSIQSRLQKPD
jgi:hypothetical protein